MKKHTWAYAALICISIALPIRAEDEEVDAESAAGKNMEPPPIALYQVGKQGRYCVSLTPDAAGCISGTDDKGEVINVMDVLKGGKVVFRNLSDAPHDMKISGKNGEDLPPQEPNANDVEKGMMTIDLTKQKITCSFHGDQLGLGYRVPEAQAFANGHNTPLGSMPQFTPGDSETKPISKTSLSDVSNFIMNGLFPNEKKRLMAGRPDIAAAYPEIAAELGMKGGKILVGNNGAVAGFVQPNSVANVKPGDGKVAITNVAPKGSNYGTGGANSLVGLVANNGEGANLIGFKKSDDGKNGEGYDFNLMPFKTAQDADTYIEFTDTFDKANAQFKMGKGKQEKGSRELASRPLLSSSGFDLLRGNNWLWWLLAATAVGIYGWSEYKDKINMSGLIPVSLLAKNKKKDPKNKAV